IFAVGNDEKALFRTAGALGELIGGSPNRVVQSCAAPRVDVGKPLTELGDVGGKVLVKEGLVGEIDDEGFVAGVGGAHQVEGGRVHGGAFVTHGAGIIYE